MEMDCLPEGRVGGYRGNPWAQGFQLTAQGVAQGLGLHGQQHRPLEALRPAAGSWPQGDLEGEIKKPPHPPILWRRLWFLFPVLF